MSPMLAKSFEATEFRLSQELETARLSCNDCFSTVVGPSPLAVFQTDIPQCVLLQSQNNSI